MTRDATGRLMVVQVVLLVVAACAIYVSGLDGPFIFDDRTAIVQNPNIRHLWPLERAMSAPPDSPIAGRPVVALTLAINYAIGGLDPTGYHVVNLVIHIGCAVLLMLVLHELFARTRLKDQGPWLSGIIALLWTVHPVQTEAVQYVTQRTEMLGSLFYLATIYAAIRSFESPRKLIPFVLTAVLCAMGMASKEIMFTAPLFVLLIDRQFFSGSFGKALRQHGPLYGMLAATWLVLLVMTVPSPRSKSVGFHHDVTAWQYLLTQSQVIVEYLRLCIWPSGMTIRYEWPMVERWTEAWWSMLLIGSLFVLTVWGMVKRHPLSLAGVLLFFVLGPSSSVVPIVTEVAAERRMYLPLAGVLVVLMVLVGWLLKRVAGDRRAVSAVGIGAAVCVIVGAVVWSVVRVQDYRDEERIWQAVLEVYPESTWAFNNLGVLYVEREEYDKAITYYRKALAIDPDKASSHANLAGVYALQKRFDEAERELRTVMQEHPEYGPAYEMLAKVLDETDRKKEAIEVLEQYLELDPNRPSTYNAIGVIYRDLERYDDALAAFVTATEVDEFFAPPFENIGSEMERRDELAQAEAYYRQAIRIQPELGSAHNRLGALLTRQGKLEEAATHFRKAVELDPQYHQARKRLAVVLSNLGHKGESIEQFQTLIEQDPEDADARRRFAQVLAGVGRYGDARVQLEAAIAQEPDNAALKQALEQLPD